MSHTRPNRSRTPMPARLVFGIALAACLGACVSVGGSFVEAVDVERGHCGGYVAAVPANADATWERTQLTLASLSVLPLTCDDAAMRATAHVTGSAVVVECAARGPGTTEITVRATKDGSADLRLAHAVLEKLLADRVAAR